MKPRRIDDQIREYYESQQLSDEARTRLKAMLRSGTSARGGSRWWWVKAGTAAGFIIVATAAVLWLAVFDSPQAIASTVARTAAVGHNEHQELEFRVSRTAELRRVMKSLDFTPVEPEMMAGMNMRVVGARYTTIQGVIAAQIVYLDPKGEPCTLYQARPVEKLARIPAGEHDVDGLRVSVWREKGLLMVLARAVVVLLCGDREITGRARGAGDRYVQSREQEHPGDCDRSVHCFAPAASRRAMISS